MEGTVSLTEVARRMEQVMFWSRWQTRRGLRDRRVGVVVSLLCASVLGGSRTKAQSPNDMQLQTFTLEEAVAFALKNYPAVRASLERVRAAEAGVGVARTSYLPRTDILWQMNRATDNNITGLVIPNSVIAPITGPVPLSPSNQSAWGSAGGLLFSWEPLDFGYRGAKVDAARAAQSRVSAEASLTRLDVSVATVNAFLTLLAAEQTARAAQADVDRRETFAKSVHVLVDNQLRAGADASRADAELARARVNLARAQQQVGTSRAAFANILGIADQTVEVRESALLGAPPVAVPPATPVSANPAAEAQHARIQESQSLVHALDRSYYPKFYLQSVVMGRGSGVDPAGKFLGGSEGLGPDRANWGRRRDRHISSIRHLLDQIEKSSGSSERACRGGALRSAIAGPDGTTSESASFARRRAKGRGEHSGRIRRCWHDGNPAAGALPSRPRDARGCFGRAESSGAGGDRRRAGAPGGLAEPRSGVGGAGRSRTVSEAPARQDARRTVNHVASPHRSPESHQRPRRRHQRRALLDSRADPHADRYLPEPESAGDLRRATVRGNVPGANGRVFGLLLRISLPLHHGH